MTRDQHPPAPRFGQRSYPEKEHEQERKMTQQPKHEPLARLFWFGIHVNVRWWH